MCGVVMKNGLTVNNLLKIYETEISKNVKNKKSLYNFEVNKMQNITNILSMLNNGDIGHKKYNIFLIYEPKCRLVMSLSVSDKIINHFVTRYSLEKNLTKYLDPRNIATRKNMGTDYGIKLVRKYLNKLKKDNDMFYILKIDISKYFYSIDHNVLKSELKDKLDDYEYDIISKIIDTTNEEYVNKEIFHNISKHNLDLPLYYFGKGLPIGNMTSQFLSIFYLHKLDHFIVHDLKLKYYVRYMDDFIIMDKDLNKLKQAREIIIEKLEQEYKLKVNTKKTFIVNSKIGFAFLGYVFKVLDNKTIIKIKRCNLEKIKKRVKKVNYLFKNKKISHYKAFCTIMTYSNCYKYSNNIRVLKLIDKYFYEK